MMIIQDLYWEQMIGYLDGMEIQIEALDGIQSHKGETTGSTHSNQIADLYRKHTIAMDRLWVLIEAQAHEWEGFRVPLEDACDDLLRTFYSLQDGSRNRAISYRSCAHRKMEPVWQQEHGFLLPAEAVT